MTRKIIGYRNPAPDAAQFSGVTDMMGWTPIYDDEPTPAQPVVIDLAHEAMRMLGDAAGQSNWIPQEHYMANDWLNDCAHFLRTGEGVNAQPVVDSEVVIDAYDAGYADAARHAATGNWKSEDKPNAVAALLAKLDRKGEGA